MTSNMFQPRLASQALPAYQFICGPMKTTIRANNMYDAVLEVDAVFRTRPPGDWVQTGDNEFTWGDANE